MLRIVKPLFDIFYPVGSYYETSNLNFNPNTNKNWFGEWVEDSKGYTTVAHDPSQTEFDTVGKKIGEKYHTLNINEIPPHYHAMNNYNGGGNYVNRGVLFGWDLKHGDVNYQNFNNPNIWTSDAGGGLPHNNIQPSIVVKRWHRIA